jgi:hypothetical protein
MKTIKNYNPVVLARNALAATGLMTLLNIIVVALHFSPIFPLSLLLPVNASYFIFNVPEQVDLLFGSLEKYQMSIPFFTIVTLVLLGLVAYSYFRSAKKPSAIKIGFGVVILDSVVLASSFNISFTFIIEFVYHAVLLYYVFKGIAALKAAKHV